MKQLRSLVSLLAFLAVLAAGAISTASAGENYKIDPVHSQVIFKINHLGVSNVYGRFNDVSGSFVLDAENPTQSSFEVKIKADSVDTGQAKRDQHLKSPDFFNATEVPEIVLRSKAIKKKSDKVYEATGTLSLHGVTKDVTAEVTQVGTGKDPWGGFRSGFEAKLIVKRGDFGMKTMADAIGDEVTVFVNIEGVRQ